MLEEKRVFLRIVAEVVLLISTFGVASLWWQLRKRKAWVKEIVTHEVFLNELVSNDAMAKPLKTTAPNATLLHPIQLFEIELRTDRSSQRIPRAVIMIVVISALIASYLVAGWCMWTNLGIFLLMGMVPITDSARRSASDHVLTLARILQRWRRENPSECDNFIAPRNSLHKLYDAVKRLESG